MLVSDSKLVDVDFALKVLFFLQFQPLFDISDLRNWIVVTFVKNVCKNVRHSEMKETNMCLFGEKFLGVDHYKQQQTQLHTVIAALLGDGTEEVGGFPTEQKF